jgi:hypothetical protein
MTTRELFLWFLGMQDCARKTPRNSKNPFYIMGLGIDKEIEGANREQDTLS